MRGECFRSFPDSCNARTGFGSVVSRAAPGTVEPLRLKQGLDCRGAIKLFADFFQSDIIVASPLGLVTKQAEGGEESTDNLDFLSSIEIAVLPRCDVLLMQNWSHVVTGEPIHLALEAQ